VEALLLAADRPLSDRRLLELLGLAESAQRDVRVAIEELNRSYLASGRCFRVESVAGGHRVLTQAALAPLIERLRGERDHSRLSQAALETLAIVAYRQPVLRAELEAIRGVACGEVLRTLIERRLVRVAGRADIVGRPLLYGTTREFLQVLGLASVDDLPKVSSGVPAAPSSSPA
jgi:segregation and condensation protein B